MSTVRKEYMQGSFTRGLLVFAISGAIAFAFFYQVYAYMFAGPSTIDAVDRSVAVEKTTPRDEVIIPATTLTEENSSFANTAEVKEDEIELEETIEEPIEETSPSATLLETTTNELVAFSIINQDGSMILDLRSAEDYSTGWIRTSTNYDVGAFQASDFVAGGNYVLVCETGSCPEAQALASKIASIAGSVAVLDGGFSGWENEGGYRVMRSE